MTMLGAPCSNCCKQCDCSSEGFDPAIASDEARGLVWLEFSSCIGSGAAGTVDAPRAVTPCDYEGISGAITGVTLTSGGSGYARLGRVAPTLSVSVSGGTSATFSVALSEETENLGDGCLEASYWSVSSVTVTAGGSGYTDDTAATFSAASGDTTVHAAGGRAYVDVDEPTNPTFDIDSDGVDAVLTAVWSELDEEDWADVRTPNPCPAPKKRTFALASVGITNGGSGYSQYDRIFIAFPTTADGGVSDQAYIDVESVDGNGAITAVFVAEDDGQYVPGAGGVYIGSLTDSLAHVVVNSCVTNGAGRYYREDPDEPPYVAAVTVAVQQESPSGGVGAVVTAIVEDDTSDPDFGKIVALNLDDGGMGYLNAPLECALPDKIYVTWGQVTVEVPARYVGGFGVYTGFPLGRVCGPAWGVNDGDGEPYCRGGVVDPHPEDAGNLNNWADARILGGRGLQCKCEGKIHLDAVLLFGCDECVAVGDSVEINENKRRFRYVCLRFDADENGCPVGDAAVVSWQTLPLEQLAGCLGDCPCPDDCDIEIVPEVSFLP